MITEELKFQAGCAVLIGHSSFVELCFSFWGLNIFCKTLQQLFYFSREY